MPEFDGESCERIRQLADGDVAGVDIRFPRAFCRMRTASVLLRFARRVGQRYTEASDVQAWHGMAGSAIAALDSGGSTRVG